MTAFVLFLCAAVFAASSGTDNYQKIYGVTDPVYGYINDLYVLEGYARPSTTGPWSGAELAAMLDVFDAASLSGASKALYDAACEIIGKDAQAPVFKAALEIDEELYINTNYSSPYFRGRDNWVRGWANEKPFLNFITDEHIGKNFYGYFDLSIGVAKDWKSGDSTERKFGDSILWSNTPFLLANDMKQLDFNMPLRAFVSAGGENWTLQIGRDRLSWGNGTTGNFVIGDHLKYHNMARFTAFDSSFKYTFLVSAFPHPQMYYRVINADGAMQYSINGANAVGSGQSQYMNGIAAFIGHRLEWKILPSLSLTLTEGVMYMSKDNKIDLIAFAPAYLYHNNYTRSNTNSILELEADWTFARGWNVYGQMVIDEFILPGEQNPKTATPEHVAEPNGLGYLAGLTYTTGAGSGILKINAEGAITAPYLYLRDGDAQAGETTREQTNGRYGINYVVAIREMSDCGGTQNYNLDFLGYKYGGDALVGNLNVDYAVPGKWNAGVNLFYMKHGTHDKYTVWTRINNTTAMNQTTPTETHQTANYNDDEADLRDAASTTVVAGLYGSYNLPWGFTAGAQLDFVSIKNPGNRTANGSISDFQITLLLSYRLD
ncbi:MAG: hypothetical protein J5775_04625 [Spirochaetales bacterium]|nr:hypothetical protein [Spirochaetales bacterium]